MQFVASGALEKHGSTVQATEYEEGEVPEIEESLYVVELPLISVGESLSTAKELKLRPDPEDAVNTGVLCGLGGASRETDEKATARAKCHASLVDMFPPIAWVPEVTKPVAKADLVAGLTVGVMAIPQSMSYASIANLPVVYGLYAASTPALAYGFLGGSGQLAVGPVALVSLLVEEGLRTALTKDECPEYYEDDDDDAKARRFLAAETPATECPDEYARLVHVCMFVVGLIQLGASILRVGFLINFLGHPVISGFTSAAAIIIGLSQVKSWLGVEVAKSQYTHSTVGAYFSKIFAGEAKGVPFALGMLSWFALWAIRKAAAKYPKKCGFLKPLGPLIVCVAALVLMICVGDELRDKGVEVVGGVPRGLPKPTIGVVVRKLPDDFLRVLPTALSVALIGFMESYAIASTLASKHGRSVFSAQELRAVGVANLFGASFSGYPVAGSFSRSAVANATGALTPLAGFVTGLVLVVTLLALPAFVRKLPKFVLASVVIASVVNLVAIDEAKRLWRVRKPDFFLWILAFLGTLFLGVLNGLAIAVGVSIVMVIAESVRPQITVLWKLPGTSIYRNVQQGDNNGQFVDGVLVVRVGASMYFANVAYIKDTLLQLAKRFDRAVDHARHNGDPRAEHTTGGATNDAASRHESLGAVRYVVVEMTPVMTLDSTAIHMLEDLVKDLRRRGVQVCFASCTQHVEDTLRRADVLAHLGYEWFHSHVNSAVEFCVRHRAAADALAERTALMAPRLLVDYPSPDASRSGDEKRDDDRGAELIDLEVAENDKPGVELPQRSRGGLGTIFRRKNSSGKTKNDANPPTKPAEHKPTVPGADHRLLVLASKHRVVERPQAVDPSENEVLAPERRALDAWAKKTPSGHSLVSLAGGSESISPQQPVGQAPAVPADKYAFLASRRESIQRSFSSSPNEVTAPLSETLAAAAVVGVPDVDAPDLMINIVVDCLDRPGLMRDITAVLSQDLTLQIRFSEAAVIARRSISVWRCEVQFRGFDEVNRAAALAESRVARAVSN